MATLDEPDISRLLEGLEFQDAKHALDFCLNRCVKRLGNDLGCAATCQLRKKYGIPPFGKAYPR
jgi:hypothetical protein